MRRFNYLWLKPHELCKRLGLAQSCVERLTPEELRRIPQINGNIRADVALHMLRPEKLGVLCEACLAPLKKGQAKYCSTICRNTHLAGRDERSQRIEIEWSNDYMAKLLEDARNADLTIFQFIRMAVEYGRHQVLLFNRTGRSQTHDMLRDEDVTTT